MIRLALAAALAAVAALAAAVPASAQQTAAPQPACPTFEVLHDDRIGALQLPAGPYTIAVRTPSTLSCAQAADLFRQFLQDFDGRLHGGWRVDAKRARFVRRRSSQAFSVQRTVTPAPAPSPTPTRPVYSGRCPATFRVLHDDRIGALELPAGQYTITLVAASRLSCQRAAKLFARFLQDYDGVLPGRWFVDPLTATFLRGTVHVGFRVEPVTRRETPAETIVVPGDGTSCNGTFRVLHDDTIGRLRFPAGPYRLIPLPASGLSCSQVADLFREFLEVGADGALPAPWRVRNQSATFTRGRSRVGFRVEPAS